MGVVAIVDYGMCNLGSISRAVEECGGDAKVTDDPRDLADAERIVLPGVGAFGDGIANLRERRLDAALTEEVMGKGKPLLGICLGMQLLGGTGFESEGAQGLGWIPADVPRLEPSATERRIPHVGWNEVQHDGSSPLFRGIPSGKDFYFVHSYHVRCTDPALVLARTPYCGGFVSAIAKGLIFGVQFHPEKSQKTGFQLLRNFLSV